MLLPTHLEESHVIRISGPTTNTVLEFHRHYGRLSLSATTNDTIPGDGSGILVSEDENVCDAVFRTWADMIENTNKGDHPCTYNGTRIIHYFPGIACVSEDILIAHAGVDFKPEKHRA